MRKIATHLVVLVVGIAVGIGGIAVASSSPEPSAHSAAADSRIVRELQDVNSTLKLINKNLGGYTSIATTPAVNDALSDIKRSTDDLKSAEARTCRAIAEKSYECPLP